MWRNQAARLLAIPRDGEAVEVHGSISVYEAGGRYQLYADTIRPAGEGALYQEFLRLKEHLEEEGLFDPARKRPTPPWPERIGLVTSPTGAALRDMLDTLRRRYPLVEAVLAPSAVQGEGAPAEIVAALERLNRVVKPDVILLARGGGSIEDLWAFNDEGVARAIAASEAPVISGVGHETDFTIADFVADLRAPTPTAAAELATPDRVDLREALSERWEALGREMQARFTNQRWELNDLVSRLRMGSPMGRVRSDRQRLDELNRRVDRILEHQVQLRRVGLRGLEQRLASLSPGAVLGRGYAVVSHEDGRLVRQEGDVAPGDRLKVQVSDGDFGAEVVED
jgi:exodeoxyribonuclease VII large subunit